MTKPYAQYRTADGLYEVYPLLYGRARIVFSANADPLVVRDAW